MEINIKPIHFEISSRLSDFIHKKVNKLEQYYDGILGAEVQLKVTKPESVNNKDVSVKLNVPGQELFADKVSDSFEESVAVVSDALAKQLIKVKEKKRGK